MMAVLPHCRAVVPSMASVLFCSAVAAVAAADHRLQSLQSTEEEDRRAKVPWQAVNERSRQRAHVSAHTAAD